MLTVVCATVAAVLVGTAGGVYAASMLNNSLSASVNIVPDASFSYYADRAATAPLEDLTLGDFMPGQSRSFTFYVKNTSRGPELLFAGPGGSSESVEVLSLTFDGQERNTLAAGDVAQVDAVLRVNEGAALGSLNFALSINATPVTSGP
ncbi:MAG: hypothetical protein Q7T04_08025 [Dehalococcoidia bacterium]|nr:hypothetical protein [Dehalococcoidia bacterium]